MKVKLHIPRLPIFEARRVFGRFLPHLRPHRWQLILGGICLLGTAGAELARPWPLKIVLDYVLIPGDPSKDKSFLAVLHKLSTTELLILTSAALLGVAVFAGLVNYGQRILLTGVGHRVAGALRLDLFTHVQQLPQSYHDYRQTGDLMARMTGDISLLKDLLVSLVLKLGSRILIVAGMLFAMIRMQPTLTLVALGVIPALFVANLHFSTRIKDASRRQRKKAGELASTLHENIASIGLVRAYTQERRQRKKFSQRVSSDVKAGLKIVRLEVSFSRTVEIITALGMSAVLWFGAQRVLAGDLSVGDLTIFLSYMRMVYRPLRDLANQSTRMAKSVAAGQRIVEVLEMDSGVEDDPNGLTAAEIEGRIRFENIDFSYRTGSQVLHGVDCEIPAGKTTVIVGPSGSGKSTLAKLLMRLYEPQTGRIMVDDRDLREYRLHSLRKQITSLAQEVTMFQASVKENIGFGNPRKGEEAIYSAARKVGAHNFIERLPEGYETVVGENGLTLSGGQRQRLAFARAALRDSRIMVFDEPASGLDPLAERQAKEALRALQDGRTVIVITHRLNFLDLADHVIYLQDGRVVDAGHPTDLKNSGGPFAKFLDHWRSQIGVVQSHPVSPTTSGRSS